MAKDLPYFKFVISEWNDGDVTICSMEAQGLFINICSIYWSKEGNLSLTTAKRRFKDCNTTVWDELIAEGVIKIVDDNIRINFLDEQLAERKQLSVTNSKNVTKRWKKPASDTTVVPSNNDGINPVYNKEEKRREENTHTVECLCSVFGKKYKPPTERLPAEAGFFRDIDAQYPKLLEVYKTDQAIIAQVTAYMKHCDQTKRKRIGTAHKLAETIVQSDWIVLTGGNISPPEVTTTAYSAAEKRRQEWTLEGWEDFYKDQLRDNNFRKHFGYGDLRSSTPMGSNSER